MKKKKIVAIVPARGGSKGIPYKNIRKLNGKPLIYFIINTLKKIKKIDRIIVSTEDKKIKRIVKQFFPKIEIIHRSQKLASDSATFMADINRVSGHLNVVSLESYAQPVYALRGNLISCKTLPNNDVDIDDYSCGSNALENSMYFWLASLFIFVVQYHH